MEELDFLAEGKSFNRDRTVIAASFAFGVVKEKRGNN